MCLNCALWFEVIDTMKSSSSWYLQVISKERMPIGSMDLFKSFWTIFFNSASKWMNGGINIYLLYILKCPSEFWLCFLLFHQKCPVKTERGGSREFGNGIFPSALSLPSAINWETPDFGPYLPVSRLEYEISQIIAESFIISCRLDFRTMKFQIFCVVWIILMWTLNVSSQTLVCNFDITNKVIGQMLQCQQHLFGVFCITPNIRDDRSQRVFLHKWRHVPCVMTSSIIPSLSTLNICKRWRLAALPSLPVNIPTLWFLWGFAWILVYKCTLKLLLL